MPFCPKTPIFLALSMLLGMACAAKQPDAPNNPKVLAEADSAPPSIEAPLLLSDAAWRKRLNEEQFRITRLGGTEQAFSGLYWDEHADGIYRCVCCNQELFSSTTKFKSGTGWPSFYQPLAPNAVEEREDSSFFSTRTEILCRHCGAHLGHVFHDGPQPTGLRYCMNSVALHLERQKPAEQ